MHYKQKQTLTLKVSGASVLLTENMYTEFL